MTHRMSYSALKRRRSFHAAGDCLESRLTLSGLTLFVTSPADGGAGTLRAAIVAANANPGSTIDFRLQLVPNTINLLGPLPLITAPVKIDGTSQPGYKGTPLITVTGGAAAAPASSGFDFEDGSSGSAIQGLEITGFNTAAITVNNTANITIGGATSGQGNVISGNPGDGISVKNAGTSGVTVEGNDIGTDPSGTVAMANGIGVSIAGAMANTIGGLVAAARNVISGNTTDGIQITSSPPGPVIGPAASLNVVEGNYIGTNAAGDGVLANGGDGVNIKGGATSNTIGGGVGAAQNVISGNTTAGVAIAGLATSGETVAGNLIGTDASGQTALANGIGVSIAGTTGNTIGGLVSAARNVISGNAADGVVISGGGQGPAASLIVVEGNYIGTNAAGNGVLANGGDGVNINGGATSNTIGGGVAAAQNVISGNTTAGIAISGSATSGETIAGNLIGTDASGQTALANGIGVSIVGTIGNTIGGLVSAARNVVAGNTTAGIAISGAGASGDIVAGNLIGTDASGQTALGNGIGVLVSGGISTSIGGTTAGAGNVISGNFTAGIELDGNAVSGIEIVGNRIGTDPSGSVAVVRSGQSDPLQALQSAGIAVIGSQGNTIGGNTSATGNLISGNYVGVMLATISGGGIPNQVLGNLIGTDNSGEKALGNVVGVYINGAAGNLVGATGSSSGNVISGNSSVGVEIYGTGSTGNTVQGNTIGLSADGRGVFRGRRGLFIQQDGIFIQDASGNLIGGSTGGAGNVISGNESAGIFIQRLSGTSSGNSVQGNFIGLGPDGSAGPGNSGYGIILFNAPNNSIGRIGPAVNRFGRNGIANIRNYIGPVPASQVVTDASRTRGRAPAKDATRRASDPAGAGHHMHRGSAAARPRSIRVSDHGR